VRLGTDASAREHTESEGENQSFARVGGHVRCCELYRILGVSSVRRPRSSLHSVMGRAVEAVEARPTSYWGHPAS
jgi:hypothetical protein